MDKLEVQRKHNNAFYNKKCNVKNYSKVAKAFLYYIMLLIQQKTVKANPTNDK